MCQHNEKQEKGMENLRFPCYKASSKYTKFMDGVERADQIRYYSQRKTSKKWWKLLFEFFSTLL
jgi:hypothetical protein